MRGLRTIPNGLIYQPNFITAEEEVALIKHINEAGIKPFEMYGKTAKRLVKGYGYRYSYETNVLEPGEPIAEWLSSLCERAEQFAAIDVGSIVQALVQRYPVGASIGWHSDKPFYEAVIGVSLGSPCIMQFQRGKGDQRHVYERILNPRSAYVMAGDVRHHWEHHIPDTRAVRYSVTFRTLAR